MAGLTGEIKLRFKFLQRSVDGQRLTEQKFLSMDTYHLKPNCHVIRMFRMKIQAHDSTLCFTYVPDKTQHKFTTQFQQCKSAHNGKKVGDVY